MQEGIVLLWRVDISHEEASVRYYIRIGALRSNSVMWAEIQNLLIFNGITESILRKEAILGCFTHISTKIGQHTIPKERIIINCNSFSSMY